MNHRMDMTLNLSVNMKQTSWSFSYFPILTGNMRLNTEYLFVISNYCPVNKHHEVGVYSGNNSAANELSLVLKYGIQ